MIHSDEAILLNSSNTMSYWPVIIRGNDILVFYSDDIIVAVIINHEGDMKASAT
jgi:hypothetical protein